MVCTVWCRGEKPVASMRNFEPLARMNPKPMAHMKRTRGTQNPKSQTQTQNPEQANPKTSTNKSQKP